MATYLYKYERYGKGKMIAKYSGGYIYDLRGITFEDDSMIIAKTLGMYLQMSKKNRVWIYRYHCKRKCCI